MQDIVPGEMRIYEGYYIPHWEVPRFCINTGRRWLGIFPVKERWMPWMPDGYTGPWNNVNRRSSSLEDYNSLPVRMYFMKIRGIAGKKGRYGHRGVCHREIRIHEVLEVREVPYRSGFNW